MSERPKPLTAEEEERFRAFLRAGPPPHVTDGQAWRLLATLDAARAAPQANAGLREAIIATLRRDDLCDETQGEHHTDDFIASFLVSLDTELRGRAASQPSDDGPAE